MQMLPLQWLLQYPPSFCPKSSGTQVPPTQIHGSDKIVVVFGLKVTKRGQIACWKRCSTCIRFPMTEPFKVMSVKPVQGCTGKVAMKKEILTLVPFTRSTPQGCSKEGRNFGELDPSATIHPQMEAPLSPGGVRWGYPRIKSSKFRKTTSVLSTGDLSG